MPVPLESLLILILVGAVAGWLAGIIVAGGGFGLVGNIIIGILGAVIGFYLFPALGIRITPNQLLATIITATAGAVILLFILGLLRR